MLAPEQINLYIAEHPEWQRKVLVRLRQLIHSVDEHIEESWRSQAPCFNFNDAPLLSLSASKTSVSVTFPKGAQLETVKKPFEPSTDEKESRVLKFREGDPLHEHLFVELVRRATALNNKTAKPEDKPEGKQTALNAEFEGILKKDPNAWANWIAFSAEDRKDYSEWIGDGRKEETRKRRIAKSLEMIREGLSRDEAQHRMNDA